MKKKLGKKAGRGFRMAGNSERDSMKRASFMISEKNHLDLENARHKFKQKAHLTVSFSEMVRAGLALFLELSFEEQKELLNK